MAKKPIARIRNWLGMASNRGPFGRKPEEAIVLRNLRCLKPGTMETRLGQRLIRWE